MPLVQRTWRRIADAYNMACARDDAAARGFKVPSGVWACERCHQPHLEFATLSRHLLTEHS